METASPAAVYLDHNATTPIADEVREAMFPFLSAEFGNPSSAYPLGRRAKTAVEKARLQVAGLLGCRAQELIFTSGGSESNNTVLKGLVDFKAPETFHLITCAVEHPAILNPALFLAELGAKVTILPVDGYGLVDPDAVRRAVTPRTGLVSIMLANNETGTLEPVADIAAVVAGYGIPLHTDASQAVGKIPVHVRELGVDFLTVAGHKLYAPKGVGALFIKEGRQLTPIIHGAGQEMGKRAGTENLVLTAGLGAACELAAGTLGVEAQRVARLRDRLQGLLFDGIAGLVLNGHPEKRLPNTLNISVPGLEGGRILEALPELMASTGAACHDRRVSLSHVLTAMGVKPEIGMGALRLTLGRLNSPEEIDRAARLIIRQVERMRNG